MPTSPSARISGGLRTVGKFKVGAATQPLVTVITSVLNGERTLEATLQSVLQQSYPHIEYIVVDGASTDGTLGLLSRYSDQIDYWISEPDRGIYDAWNKALKHARGEWICFLGADDHFCDNDAVARLAAALPTALPTYRAIYGKITITDPQGNGVYDLGDPWPQVAKRFRQTMCIPHPGLLHHRSLFESLGEFDPSFRIAGDYEFLLRHLKDHAALFVDGPPGVAMQAGGVSSSPRHSWLQLQEVRRAQRRNGLPYPGAIWLTACLRVGIRRVLWAACGDRSARKLLDLGRRIMGLPPHWTRVG